MGLCDGINVKIQNSEHENRRSDGSRIFQGKLQIIEKKEVKRIDSYIEFIYK